MRSFHGADADDDKDQFYLAIVGEKEAGVNHGHMLIVYINFVEIAIRFTLITQSNI